MQVKDYLQLIVLGLKYEMIYPENSLILAPLSGFTDLPYRRSARRHGCTFAFTEMVDAGALVYSNEKTLMMANRGSDEEWLGIQLVGSNRDHLTKAVEIVNQRNFDVLDFNLGCPAPKVVRKNEGAKLAEDADKAASSLEIIVRNSQIPVSAKIRILDENDPSQTLNLAKKLIDAGAQAITVHGRLRKNYYAGPVSHEIIAALNSELDVDVIANGGVNNYDDFCEIRKRTGCDKVMLARGAMGNPWIFNEINDLENWCPPTPAELADEVEQHILEMIDYYGLKLGLTVARKIILDYMRGRGFPRVLKTQVIKIADAADLKAFCRELRKGPSNRYKTWLQTEPEATRRMELK